MAEVQQQQQQQPQGAAQPHPHEEPEPLSDEQLMERLPESIQDVHRLVLQQDGAQRVVDAGGVPRLVEMLDTYDLYYCGFAAWTLLNITVGADSSQNTFCRRQAIYNAGAIPRLIKLLDINRGQDYDLERLDRIVSGALSVLWNLTAGHSDSGCRIRSEAMIQHGAIDKMMYCLLHGADRQIQQAASRCLLGLSACTTGTTALVPSLPELVRLLPEDDTPLDDIAMDVFYLLSNIATFGGEEALAALNKLGVADLSVKWLDHEIVSVNAALILSNLVGNLDSHALLDQRPDLVPKMAMELQLAIDGRASTNGIVIFEPWELAYGIRNLSINRGNRLRMLASDHFVEQLHRLVTSKDHRCSLYGAQALANLSAEPTATCLDRRDIARHVDAAIQRHTDSLHARDALQKAAYELRRNCNLQATAAASDTAAPDARFIFGRTAAGSLASEATVNGTHTACPEPGQAQAPLPPPRRVVVLSHADESSNSAILGTLRKQLEQDCWKVLECTPQSDPNELLDMLAPEVVQGLVVACCSRSYKANAACREHIEFASRLDVKIVPLLLDSGCTFDGWLRSLIASTPVDLSNHETDPCWSVLLQRLEQSCSPGLADDTDDDGLSDGEPSSAPNNSQTALGHRDVPSSALVKLSGTANTATATETSAMEPSKPATCQLLVLPQQPSSQPHTTRRGRGLRRKQCAIM